MGPRASRECVEQNLEEDPTTENVGFIEDFDEEWLFRMTWVDQVDLLVQMLTNSETTILDAVWRNGQWHLRVLYPERESFSKTHAFSEDRGLTFAVRTIPELESDPAGRHGLTTAQYEFLTGAARQGLFEVTREMSLQEFAAEFGISNQAASERLRRGANAPIEDTLFVGLNE